MGLAGSQSTGLVWPNDRCRNALADAADNSSISPIRSRFLPSSTCPAVVGSAFVDIVAANLIDGAKAKPGLAGHVLNLVSDLASGVRGSGEKVA